MSAHRASRRDLPAVEMTALLAGRLAVAGPSPEFADRLRGRLLAVAAVAPQAVGAASNDSAGGTDTAARAAAVSRALPRPAWLPRLVVGGAAGVIAVAGVGVATSRALPGEPLYAAKQQVESWQLSLHHGDASRGREELAFARTRLAEVTALSRHHDLTSAGAGGTTDDRIASTLHTMDAETRSGADDLVTAAGQGDPHAADDLLAFATTQSTQLAAVVPDLPSSAAPAVASSRALLAAVSTQAAALPGATSRVAARAPQSPSTPTASPTPSPSTSPSPTATGSAAAPSTGPSTGPSTDPSVSPSASPSTSPPPTSDPAGIPTPSDSATDAPSDSPEPSDTPTPTPSPSAPDTGGATASTPPSDMLSASPTDSAGPLPVLPTVSVPPVSVGPVVVGPIVVAPPTLFSPAAWFGRPFGPSLFGRLLTEVRLVLIRITQ